MALELSIAFFGPYRLSSRLATGGMAEVYVGRKREADGVFGELLAVKRLLPHLQKDVRVVRMFLNEGRITQQISHPNVIRVLDVGDVNGEPYIALELLDGHTFEEIREKAAERGERVPLGVVLRVLLEACAGLDAAHNAKDEHGNPLSLVHRDFTPDNIHVDIHGKVKVIDFGIARTSAHSAGTEPGVLKGKYFYMSPEMILSKPVDRRADVFAAGVMLYEQLCGHRPFTGTTVDEVLNRISAGVLKPPKQFNPSISDALDAVCVRALANNPTARFFTLEEFTQALENIGATKDAYTHEQVAEYVRSIFPEHADKRRDALRSARDADPSLPGYRNPFASSPAMPAGMSTGELNSLLPEGAPPAAPQPSVELAPATPVASGSPAPSAPATALPPAVAAAGPPASLGRVHETTTASAPVPKAALKFALASVLGLGLLAFGAYFAWQNRGSFLTAPEQALAAARNASTSDERASLLTPLKRSPDVTARQLKEATELLLDVDAWNAVLELSESWKSAAPNDVEPLLAEAQAAIETQQGKRAETAIAAAAAKAPNSPEPNALLSRLHEVRGDLTPALDALEKALARKSDVAWMLRKGILLSRLERLNEAAPALEEGLRKKFDADAATELSLVRFRQGRTDEAIAWARRVLKKSANHGQAHVALGAALFRAGDTSGARKAYEEATRLLPGDERAWVSLCQLEAKSPGGSVERIQKEIETRFPKRSAELLGRCRE